MTTPTTPPRRALRTRSTAHAVSRIGADLPGRSDELDPAAAMVSTRADRRRAIRGGDPVFQNDPADRMCCVEFRGSHRDSRQVLLVFGRDRERYRDRDAVRLAPSALRPGVRFRDGTPDQDVAALRSAVQAPFRPAQDADVLSPGPISVSAVEEDS